MSVRPRRNKPTMLKGIEVLRDPLLNKGLGFSQKERSKLGLRGLLPARVQTQAGQLNRRLAHLRSLSSDLEKYINLNALHDRNEALFFRMIIEHPDEIMPLIYTPTVGLACQKFGSIFTRPRGIFISPRDKGHIAKMLRNWHRRDIGVIVVTDGERILGLGDLGANGMGIPVGKLALYTACAGIAPEQCLPVMLDVGTNNESLLNDPFYIGLRRKRLRGKTYDALIEEFFRAAQKVFPGALIQFEDFGNTNAFRLLHQYRNRICTFNDDIQGTAAVSLAGMYSALRITAGKLQQQRILCLGAGEAATGICDLLVAAMMEAGLPEAEAKRRCWLFDSRGLVVGSRRDLTEHKLPYAHDYKRITGFISAIKSLQPTAIIGVAAARGMFNREVLKTMAKLNERPIIFALSNPTSVSECTAEQAYRYTDGRAIFAGGSPFDSLSINGRRFVPRQGNNAYIFPGVGLGVLVSGARRITNEMFLAAARALARQVTQKDLDQGSIYPPLSQIRKVSAHIASAVAEVAFTHGLATKHRPRNLLAHVKAQMYDPHY